MRTLSLLLIFALISGFSFAQKDKDKDSKNAQALFHVFKDVTGIDNSDYSIVITDIVSKAEYCKFKIKITNKTADYIVFKGEEVVFKFPFGDFQPKEKVLYVDPFSTESKVLEIKAPGNSYLVETFELVINGMYKLPAKGRTHNAPDFQLPPNASDFEAGPFACSILKRDQQTDQTSVQFKCKYNGQDYGILNPGKLVVRVMNKQTQKEEEYSTTNLKSKIKVLVPGEEDKFIATFQVPAKVNDMQFATMNIVWKDTFQESQTEAMAAQKTTIELDPVKTEARNKK